MTFPCLFTLHHSPYALLSLHTKPTHAHEYVCAPISTGIMKCVSYGQGSASSSQMSRFAVPSFSGKLLSPASLSASFHLLQTIPSAWYPFTSTVSLYFRQSTTGMGGLRLSEGLLIPVIFYEQPPSPSLFTCAIQNIFFKHSNNEME